MLDYHKLIDEIRGALFTASDDDAEYLRATAADYAVACNEVNDRLQQASDLLRKGQISEAIRHCEMEPNLLDSVACLDFPEHDELLVILASFDIAAPPPLSLEIAADLNDAYASAKPMETLLRQHRLLAMARSPLRQRLPVLRRLAILEDDNPLWREDVETFERERLKEINAELSDALASGSSSVVAELEKELTQEAWLEAPPQPLISRVKQSREHWRQEQARAALEGIEHRLNNAFAELDLDGARDLRDYWNKIWPHAHLDLNTSVCERIAPAMEWLADEDEREASEERFRIALSNLEKALDRNRPTETLERLHHAVIQEEQEIPQTLEQRYRSRIAEQQLSKTRKTRLAVLSIVAAAVLVAGLIGWGIVSYRLAQEIARHAAAIEELINDDKILEAQGYLDKLAKEQPAVRAAAEIEILAQRLAGLVKQETDRQIAFQQAMQQAESNGVEHPDMAALNEARRLAKTQKEKLAVLDLGQRIDTAKHTAQEKVNKAFEEEFVPLRHLVNALDENTDDIPEVLLRDAENLYAKLEGMQARHAKASRSWRNQIPPLLDRLKAIRKEKREQTQRNVLRSKLERRLSETVGSPGNYQVALRAYQAQAPSEVTKAELKETLADADLWQPTLEWSRLVERQDQLLQGKTNTGKIRDFVKSARFFVNQSADFPNVAKLETNLTVLEPVARRGIGSGSLVKPLQEMFRDPTIADSWMIENSRGRHYFLDKPTIPNTNAVWLKYLSGKHESKGGSFGSSENIDVVRAPQVQLAAEVDKQLRAITNKEVSWEKGFYTLLKAIRDDHETDPLLRLKLAHETLKVACQGSNNYLDIFEDLLKSLNPNEVAPFAVWINPGDAEATSKRPAAKVVLRKLDRLTRHKDHLTANPLNDIQNLDGRYSWIGWLQHRDRERWDCIKTAPVSTSGPLFVIHRFEDGGPAAPAQWIRVGTLQNGKITLQQNQKSWLLGQPVFLKHP